MVQRVRSEAYYFVPFISIGDKKMVKTATKPKVEEEKVEKQYAVAIVANNLISVELNFGNYAGTAILTEIACQLKSGEYSDRYQRMHINDTEDGPMIAFQFKCCDKITPEVFHKMMLARFNHRFAPKALKISIAKVMYNIY